MRANEKKVLFYLFEILLLITKLPTYKRKKKILIPISHLTSIEKSVDEIFKEKSNLSKTRNIKPFKK